jgi:hypothetical protein
MEEIKRKQQDLEKFKDDMETVMGQVFYIMKESRNARNSDGVLLVAWLQIFKGVDSFHGLTSMALDGKFNFETVRRARQKIQAAGYWLPDDQTIIKRRRLQEIWSQVMGDQVS